MNVAAKLRRALGARRDLPRQQDRKPGPKTWAEMTPVERMMAQIEAQGDPWSPRQQPDAFGVPYRKPE
jgi:hypothetical protein